MKESPAVSFAHVLVVTPETETSPRPVDKILHQLEQENITITRTPSITAARIQIHTISVDLVLYDLGDDQVDITVNNIDDSTNGNTEQPEQPDQPLAGFIARLRGEPATYTVPVVVLGKAEHTASWHRAIRAGAVDYLPYSASRMELMRTIELASERQNAVAAEVRRQVQARYHDIIGIIQHEFRTPMTLLLGYSEYLREVLEDDMDKEELRVSIEAILSGSERLNHLVESFLLLSELQYRQAEQMQMQNVAPEILWREVQAILRTEIEDAGMEIIYDVPAEMPGVVVDPELVREALTRLFDNALRYVRSDSRQIRLGVAFDEEWIWWTIEDDGPGINMEQMQQILEPFGRAENNQYAPQSLGLSLTIVKRVAELHGGTLQLESEIDNGSRFTLRLPFIPVRTEEQNASETGS